MAGEADEDLALLRKEQQLAVEEQQLADEEAEMAEGARYDAAVQQEEVGGEEEGYEAFLNSSEDEAELSRRTGEPLRLARPCTAGRGGRADAETGYVSGTASESNHAAPAAPTASDSGAASTATELPTRCYETLGHKRQRLVRNDDAPNGDAEEDGETEQTCNPMDEEAWYENAEDVAETRRIPCLLSWMAPVTTAFESEALSFEVIYARRCIEKREYYAPMAADDTDGLWIFLCQQVLALLEPAQAGAEAAPSPLSAIAAAFGLGDAAAVRSVLRCCDAPSEPPGAESPEAPEAPEAPVAPVPPLYIEDVQAQFSQLKELEGSSEAVVTSAGLRELGADVDGNVLRLDDGRVFRPTTRSEALEGAMVSILLANDLQRITVTVQSDGVFWRPTDNADAADATKVASCDAEAVHALLLPSTWSLRDVVRCRRRFACDAKKMEAAMDPYRLFCLAAALAGEKAEGRWVELLRLAAADTFLGIHAKVGGRDAVDLWHCDSQTALWKRDHADSELRALLKRVCREV